MLPILFMVQALTHEESSIAFAFATALGEAALAVAVILVLGRVVIRPVFRFVGGGASREMFLAAVLLVIIGTAIVTQRAGLSMALGAFLTGLLFAETEYRHQIEVDIEPFKGLLLGLFFVSVGMSIDLAQVAANPLWLSASVLGLFLVKGAILYALARLAGRPPSVALECALLLGQGGEFAFLVFGFSLAADLVSNESAQFMLIVTGLTMATTPLIRAARAASPAWWKGGTPATWPTSSFLPTSLVKLSLPATAGLDEWWALCWTRKSSHGKPSTSTRTWSRICGVRAPACSSATPAGPICCARSVSRAPAPSSRPWTARARPNASSRLSTAIGRGCRSTPVRATPSTQAACSREVRPM